MTFSKKLSELRKRAGLSQEQLAEMLNVSRQSVSKWESQQTLPETEKLIVLSDLFRVSLDVLLKDEYELDAVPSCPAPSGEEKPEPAARSPRHRAVLFGVVSLLLIATLVLGVLAVRSGSSTTPNASVSSTQVTTGTTQRPDRAHLQNQMKFKQYLRGIMKYITAQNGKSKGDSHNVQDP